VGQRKEFKINEEGKWQSEKQKRQFLFHARVLFLKNVTQIKLPFKTVYFLGVWGPTILYCVQLYH
jgi:hypothetical protein